MTNQDITKAIYNNDEVLALYLGGNLIYSRAPESPTYGVNQLVGKFTDDSTEDDWWYGIRSSPIYDYELQYLSGPEFDVDVNIKLYDWGFEGNDKLERIDHLPKTTSSAFSLKECTSLKYINFNGADTSNYTTLSFRDCTSLTSLDLSSLNTSKLRNMTLMFTDCTSLTSLDLSGWDLSGIQPKDLGCMNMFKGCTSLTSLNLSGWNWETIVAVSYMFDYCTALNTVIGPIYNIGVNLNLKYSPLTNESAMVFINGLIEVNEVKTIYFKQSTFDTLTEEQIALATAKGWTVASL